jgi:hypothetical protein
MGLATILEGTIREIVRQELKAVMADGRQPRADEPLRGRWLTPPAAARQVGIPEKAVRAMIKERLIPHRLRNINPNPRQPKYIVDVDAVAAEAARVSRVVHNDQMPESVTARAARIRAKTEGR